MLSCKNKYKQGQYFTTNKQLQENVVKLILNDPSLILEPSVGRGHLVAAVKNAHPSVEFDMYEIDDTLSLVQGISNNVRYCDFMKEDIMKTYKTIIGNPPYIKTSTKNLYIQFIEKCYNLLEPNGELIFIVPSDFFKLTSSMYLLRNMMIYGSFTHIYHPHKENLFKNATIDIVVFRYCKNPSINKTVLYNGILREIINTDGLLTFPSSLESDHFVIKDYFNAYVGLVSAKESVYKHEILGNITLLNGKNKLDKYIYIDTYPSDNASINNYLCSHKDALISRKIRKFSEKNWFEWGAPRNIKTMQKYKGQKCIYIHSLTRKNEVAFVGTMDYFGGGLIALMPHEKNNCNLETIAKYMNSNAFKNNFMYSSRFKIGHRLLCNSMIPCSCL